MTTNTIQTVEVITRGIQGPAGISDGDRGDVTVSSNGTSIVIDSDAVTYDKIQDLVTANRVLGASAAGTIGEVQITNDYISSSAAIALSKLATGALPTSITVTSANISDLSIVNADVNASAAIDGTKISPDFGSQNIVTTGTVNGKVVIAKTDLSVTSNSAGTSALSYDDSTGVFTFTPPDLSSYLTSVAGSALTGTSLASGIVSSSLTSVGSLSSLDVTANITVGGTVDGVDIAARNTLFSGLTSISGVLTDGVTATTQSASDNSTKIATTAYADTAIANLVDSSPSTLNTLNELAAALGDDANFSTTVTNSIATKLPLAGGTLTGTLELDGDFWLDASGTASRDVFWDSSESIFRFYNSAKATFGNNDDLQIYFDGSHSYIANTGGNLYITEDGYIELSSANGGEKYATFNKDGAVELYWDDSKKFETYQDGVKCYNHCRVEGGEGENATLALYADEGDESDDQFLITSTGSALQILGNYDNGWHRYLQVTPNGGVQLYYDAMDGSSPGAKFETTSTGCTINGNLALDGGSGSDVYITTANGGGIIYQADQNGHVFQTFASSSWHTRLTIADNGDATFAGVLTVEASSVGGYAANFDNDGGALNYGVKIQCGTDNASNTNYAVTFADGDGDEQGYITFTSGTVTYGAFTAHHPCIVPDSDNPSDSSNAYPYGTLLEIISIEYTKKDGADTERGIRYKVQKTQSANSRKILGAYGSSMNGGPSSQTNEHQALVLGDGHILVNNSGGNIEVGDGICSSSTAGIGQKATANPSMIIGIAQEAITFTGSETKLVAVQYGLQQFIPWT